jgi:alpha-2-macroglobulin-like protein
MSRQWTSLGLVFFVVCWLMSSGQIFAISQHNISDTKGGSSGSDKATTQTLGGPDRYLTFLSSDKPIYRPGEKVYIRGVMLNAANHKPLVDGQTIRQTANATIQIKGPKGEIVARGGAVAQNSVWGFAWEVPEGQAGGEYTIHASYPGDVHPPAERKFDIRAYRAPRLKSQITFMRDGYGPGDKVSATLDVKRAEGGVPEGAKVTVTARVDGMQIDGGIANVDAKGLCSVSFDLPGQIPRGEGTLALVIEDGGVVETASKTIPILLQTVDLQIFPEGGDLVAGYKNRVYLQANQPNGKPADLVGKVMCKQNGQADECITEFRTEHEGRGRFEFTPDANRQYVLTISEPAGIKTVYPLPKAKSDGAVIRSDRDIFKKGQPLTVQVGCTDKSFRVTLAKREVEVAHHNVDQSKGAVRKRSMQRVALDVPADLDGVLTVTVWDERGTPLAERIVFREAAKPLIISITPDKNSYVPGESAKLTVKATNEDGKPVSATVGVTVTDDSVLEMVEKREQPPRLPVMVFLEPEVKDLADAHVYMDPNNPKAPLATDLLLGTQGWRRFALMDLDKFVLASGDQARRVVAFEKAAPKPTDRLAWHGLATGAGLGGAKDMMPWVPAIPADQDAQLQGAVHQHFQHFEAGAFAARPGTLSKKAAAPNSNQAELTDIVIQPRGLPEGSPIPDDDQAFQAFQKLPQKVARVDGPRDMNKFQVVPMVVDERHHTAGRDERHAKGAEGSPNQAGLQIGAIAGRNRQMVGGMDMLQRRLGGRRGMVMVREFAHQVRPDRKPTDRVDFAETLYWNTGVKTDPTTGEGTINFGLNDSVTTFRVFADGFTDNGAVGAANVGVNAIQPFYAEAKLPLEVTAGDQVLLPISLVNATASDLDGTDVKVDLNGDFKLAALQKGGQQISAGNRVRWIQPIIVGFFKGIKDFVLSAKAGPYEDKVTRKLSVKPKGFPIEVAFGGILEPGKPVLLKITIEKDVVPGSVISNTGVYPTPLANMTEALERLIQDPNGCFEQTSSTSYPLTMAQQYFQSHSGVDPKLVETSRQKLDAGYKKLVGFWCPDKGYEWFGQDPGHEALTAFGLLHFADMSQVLDVDQNMVATTRAWLLKQKDGQGGFTRKRRSLHSWIEDKDCSNAYILWSLLESKQPVADLKTELASLKTTAESSQNNYVVALAANTFYLADDKPEAKKLMDRLVAKQQADGSENDIKSSIVGSGGESLEVEGTALTTLAWLREPAYAGNVERSIKFLADSCKAGRYGSTQATVLALRAIVTYDKQRARPKAPGKVRVYVDGQPVGDWVAFDKSTQEALKLPDLSELLSAGEHKVEIRMEGGAPMPYSLAVKYNSLKPASANDCKLDLSVKIAQDKVVEGESTEANVTVTNKTKEVVPNPVAIVGLPGGLEPRHDQLKELVKKGTIDSYEVIGREVVLYWRALPGDATVEVPLSLIAAVPGTYTGPASRAYLYYTDENKQWVDGLKVEIAAK